MTFDFVVPDYLEPIWFEGLDHIVNTQMKADVWQTFLDICEPYGPRSGSWKFDWAEDGAHKKRRLTIVFPDETAMLLFRLAASGEKGP